VKKFWRKVNINALLLFCICLISIFLRFYNLKWDEGYFFHPDERNIAGGVVNLDPANGDYNPDFFAYGTLPIYLIRIFSGNNFEKAILAGRSLSAVFSVLIVFLSYKIADELLTKNKDDNRLKTYPIITALLVTFLPGMIQFAHLATFETFLTFEYLLTCFLALKLSKEGKWWYVLTGIVLGAAIATKIVSLAVIPVYFIAHFIFIFQNRKDSFWKKILKFFTSPYFHAGVVLTVLSAFIFSPYVVLDYTSFKGAMNYEGPVARGTLPVFYTQQFQETIPFVYQLLKVFPFILGWPLTVLSLLFTFFYFLLSIKNLILLLFKKKFQLDVKIFIMVALILGYGIFHWMMYVKWTRYMIPLLPMFVIITMYGFAHIQSRFKLENRKFYNVLLFILVAFTLVQGANYFSIYLKPDPRVMAAQTESKKITDPKNVHLLSEIYDMGVVPWNTYYNSGNIPLFNFYDLDEPEKDVRIKELSDALDKAEYIFIPSNRIYYTKLRMPEKYPLANQYYNQLFDGTLGFKLVAEYNRDTLLEDLSKSIFKPTFEEKYFPGEFKPDESFHVFDSPTVLVFRKVK
jgi:4-amino-4-deoxy-L-arabinose transferase-like glycosyltransferase